MIAKFNLKDYIETNYKSKYLFAKDIGTKTQNVDYWLKIEWKKLHYNAKVFILEGMLPCVDDKIDVNGTDGIRTINLEKGGVHVELKYRQTTVEESETAPTHESPREAYKRVEIEILEAHLFINDEYVEDELTNDFVLEYYSRIKEFEEYI